MSDSTLAIILVMLGLVSGNSLLILIALLVAADG